MTVPASYPYYSEYILLRDCILRHAPPDLVVVTGVTAHYGLPDFRLTWHKIRVVGLFPRPKGVELLLEFRKFMAHPEGYDAAWISQFEDACGALITNKNGLLTLRAVADIDIAYLETYLALGMRLYRAYLQKRHPALAAMPSIAED